MTGTTVPPPARERNRYGIRSFHEGPPLAREALLDRVELRARGTVLAPTDDCLRRFIERISAGGTNPALFGRRQRRGNRWEASCLMGSTISGGELTVYRRGGEAWLDLKLIVNPMRTLGHLLDTHVFDRIKDLSPSEFFARSPHPSAIDRTLDGRDNMVSDFLAFSGSVHDIFVQRVATYLDAFETALKHRVLEELCPPGYGYETSEDSGVLYAWNEGVHLALDWGGLTLSQCEVCWERHDPAALEKTRSLATGVLDAARSATVGIHLGKDSLVERELGALSVKVPLVPDRITLAVYAKAIDRLRFEVRYNSDLPDEVRGRLSLGPRKLTDWFDAVREEAASRVPWNGIRELMLPVECGTIDALADLLEAVADVTDKAKSKRRSILHQLLLHGSITATNRTGNAPSAVLERLADRGVVEHVRLIARDAMIGRRYRLAPRFAGLSSAELALGLARQPQ